MARSIVIGIGIVLLSACAIPPTRVEPEQLARIQSVGVISALGEEMNFVHVSLMAFGNRRATFPARDMQVDDYAEGLIKESLERTGRYRVTSLKDLRPLRQKDASSIAARLESGGVGSQLDFEALEQRLRARAAAEPVDAIVVVSKARNQDFILYTNQHLEGLGLYTRVSLGPIAAASFASFSMTLLDGRSFNKIGERTGVVVNPHRGLLASELVPAHKRLDASYIVTELNELTSAQVQFASRSALEVLGESIPVTLRVLGFNVQARGSEPRP